MNQKIVLLGTILALTSISVPLVINFTTEDIIHYTQQIDPRFSEITKDGFVISSDLDVSSIDVVDDKQAIMITILQNTYGFIHMDDPLPILQELFPDKDILSFIVLSNDIEIPYTLEGGKLGITVNDTSHILIIGFSNTKSDGF